MVGMTAVRLGLAGLIVAAAVSNGIAARTPCPGGTFEVQGGPLLVGAPADWHAHRPIGRWIGAVRYEADGVAGFEAV